MKTYDVCVHYQADVHYTIIAMSEEHANQMALRMARSNVPYDNLYIDVAYTDEVTT